MESNVQKLKDALRLCVSHMCAMCREAAYLDINSKPCVNGCEVLRIAKEARDLPLLRNCDVGTAEEQYGRFLKWCKRYVEMTDDCSGCPAYKKRYNNFSCQIEWGQMPYIEGGEE